MFVKFQSETKKNEKKKQQNDSSCLLFVIIGTVTCSKKFNAATNWNRNIKYKIATEECIETVLVFQLKK